MNPIHRFCGEIRPEIFDGRKTEFKTAHQDLVPGLKLATGKPWCPRARVLCALSYTFSAIPVWLEGGQRQATPTPSTGVINLLTKHQFLPQGALQDWTFHSTWDLVMIYDHTEVTWSHSVKSRLGWKSSSHKLMWFSICSPGSSVWGGVESGEQERRNDSLIGVASLVVGLCLFCWSKNGGTNCLTFPSLWPQPQDRQAFLVMMNCILKL